MIFQFNEIEVAALCVLAWQQWPPNLRRLAIHILAAVVCAALSLRVLPAAVVVGSAATAQRPPRRSARRRIRCALLAALCTVPVIRAPIGCTPHPELVQGAICGAHFASAPGMCKAQREMGLIFFFFFFFFFSFSFV
jgi:hypothetical protein